MLNIIVVALIIGLLIVAARKTIKDLRSSRCSGCSKNCQAMRPVSISLKNQPK